MRLIDLHTHSTASDGSLSPEKLVRHAKNNGLSAIAITDHDTIDGIEEALLEGERAGVEVIPGIEISVDYKPEMHILGYFPDGGYTAMKGILAVLKESREERNPKIIKRLNELGLRINMDEVREEAQGDIVARPHIASIMVKKGYVGSVREAFDKYLAGGKPAYFKKDKLDPEGGIKEIAKAGGIPVLAHPIYLYLPDSELDELLMSLSTAGLKGMECMYVDNSEEYTEKLLKLAQKHSLLVTGGSDFHGEFKPDIEIGKGRGNLKIPYELLERLKDLKQKGWPT